MSSDLLQYALSTNPEKLAVVSGSTSFSFNEVHRRANGLMRHLAESDVKPGDRVVLLAKNVPQFLEIKVACMRQGAVLVPINFRLAAAEVDYIAQDCEPAIVIYEPELAESIKNIGGQKLAMDHAYEGIVSQGDDVEPSTVDPDCDCTILYTSGTTGRPKGAVLKNRALYARINANLFEYAVSSTDVFLQCLPMFHIASNVSYSYTYAGATNIFLKDFHPLAVLELLAQHQVSTALLVPTMINALVHQPETKNADLSSLTRIAYGASPIAPSLLTSAMELIDCDFFQMYGMTETSAATVLRSEHHNPSGSPELLASAGQTALGMQTRVVNDKDQPVDSDVVGEVVCKGDAVMHEYWKKPEATQEVLKDGWMHTGDMGYQNEDGFFFITDRKKDMIVSGGENIYPREVEDVLFEHPDVLEAAVIGVPDETWGERVHACVVSEENREIDLNELSTFLRERLAGYKLPRSFDVFKELPKNAAGKILKTELRQPYWENTERHV